MPCSVFKWGAGWRKGICYSGASWALCGKNIACCIFFLSVLLLLFPSPFAVLLNCFYYKEWVLPFPSDCPPCPTREGEGVRDQLPDSVLPCEAKPQQLFRCPTWGLMPWQFCIKCAIAMVDIKWQAPVWVIELVGCTACLLIFAELGHILVQIIAWAQNWTQHSRCGLTSVQYRGMIPSLLLLATPFLIQARMPLAFLATWAHCWLMFSWLSTSTPRSFSIGQLSSPSPPSLPRNEQRDLFPVLLLEMRVRISWCETVAASWEGFQSRGKAVVDLLTVLVPAGTLLESFCKEGLYNAELSSQT